MPVPTVMQTRERTPFPAPSQYSPRAAAFTSFSTVQGMWHRSSIHAFRPVPVHVVFDGAGNVAPVLYPRLQAGPGIPGKIAGFQEDGALFGIDDTGRVEAHTFHLAARLIAVHDVCQQAQQVGDARARQPRRRLAFVPKPPGFIRQGVFDGGPSDIDCHIICHDPHPVFPVPVYFSIFLYVTISDGVPLSFLRHSVL